MAKDFLPLSEWLQRDARALAGRGRARVSGLFSRISTLLSHPPKPVAGMIIATLMGTAVTAFGVSRQLPPEPLPMQRLLTESVLVPLTVVDHGGSVILHRHDSIRRNDTPELALRRLGIEDSADLRRARTDALVQSVFDGKPGRLIEADTTVEGRLLRLVLRGPSEVPTAFRRVTLQREGTGALRSTLETLSLGLQTVRGSGMIESSLFSATESAGVPDPITEQLAELFSADVDFRREVQRGDRFAVIYEVRTADGLEAPWAEAGARLTAARFIRGKDIHEAVWYQAPGSDGAFYTFDGAAKQHAFLAAPLEYSRMSSGFSRRFHPLLKRWKEHLGVDYAAPRGTIVRSVGAGTVDFAGWRGGYGRVISIQHEQGYQTLYAHLNRIDVKAGQVLSQGQAIGAVGDSGWATGPHLHFELLQAGQHLDPVAVARESEALRIDAAELPVFRELTQIAKRQLRTADTAVAFAQRVE